MARLPRSIFRAVIHVAHAIDCDYRLLALKRIMLREEPVEQKSSCVTENIIRLGQSSNLVPFPRNRLTEQDL